MEGTDGGRRLAGPFLREYVPPGRFRPVSAMVASVLYYRNGSHRVVWPDARAQPFSRQTLVARPYSVVDVALGKHRSSFAMQLPAAGGAAFFQTEVDVAWEVVDPYLVARARVEDVADLIEPELKKRLRKVSSRFAITEAARMAEAIHDRMESGGWEPIGSELGLATSVYVHVDLDERARDRVRDAEDEDFKEERIARRAEKFQAIVLAGDYAQAAWEMAQDPEASRAVLKVLRDERRADRREALDFVGHMIDQGMIEPRHVSEQTLAVIDYVKQSSGRVLDLDPGRLFTRDRPGIAGPPSGGDEPRPERRDPDPWDVDRPGSEGNQGRWSDAWDDWGAP